MLLESYAVTFTVLSNLLKVQDIILKIKTNYSNFSKILNKNKLLKYGFYQQATREP